MQCLVLALADRIVFQELHIGRQHQQIHILIIGSEDILGDAENLGDRQCVIAPQFLEIIPAHSDQPPYVAHSPVGIRRKCVLFRQMEQHDPISQIGSPLVAGGELCNILPCSGNGERQRQRRLGHGFHFLLCRLACANTSKQIVSQLRTSGTQLIEPRCLAVSNGVDQHFTLREHDLAAFARGADKIEPCIAVLHS